MMYSELYPVSMQDGHGLVYTLSLQETIPWKNLSITDKQSLERAYYVRSGEKRVYSKFIESTELYRVQMIAAMYSEKWTKYWNLFKLEYDPLAAYIVEENGNRDKTNDDTHTTDYGRIENQDSTDTGTVTDVLDGNINSTDSVFGFNSVTAVPSDTSTDKEDNTNTETRDLAGNRKTTYSGTDTLTKDDKEHEEYGVTKKGNIGYSTPQKLLSEDFVLWEHPFFDMVFSDIDRMIMLKIYTC